MTDAWRGVLEKALRAELGEGVAVRDFVRRPFAGSASHRLEEFEVAMRDGSKLSLVAKDVGPGGMSPIGAAVKPARLLDSRRESLLYLGPLRRASLGTPRCYGLWEGPDGDGRWLLLERAPGRELFQWGGMEVWTAASRWLARLHARFAGRGPEFASKFRLLPLDRAHLEERMEQARSAVAESAAEPAAKAAFEAVCKRYGEWIERSDVSPPTLLHGDYYPTNILVERGRGAPGICPVDWEMASWGPGVSDLAALASGAWSPAHRSELAEAYLDEARRLGSEPSARFEAALQAWRLHVAVRWLGWAVDWTPPPEQRRDWLEEALRVANEPLAR